MDCNFRFGTFRDSTRETGSYKGSAAGTAATAAEPAGTPSAIKKKKPAPFKANATMGMTLYFLATTVIAAGSVLAVLGAGGVQPFGLGLPPAALGWPAAMAAFVAFGPIATGLMLRISLGDSQPMSWPFHKEAWVGSVHESLALNLGVGSVLNFCILFKLRTATWIVH